MKRFLVSIVVLCLSAFWLSFGLSGSAQSIAETVRLDSDLVSTTLVLSQVNGGGGGSTGTYLFDYVEIKNVSSTSQSLNGLALFYASAVGNFTSTVSLPNVSLSPGQYYLVQLGNAGTAGNPLPVTPDTTSTNISMSATSGKIAIAPAGSGINSCGATATPCNGSQLALIVDWVAYGAAGNGAAGNGEGGTSVNNGSPITSSQGGVRKGSGCTDTDNNNADFDVITAPVPRNSSSSTVVCSSDGTQLFAAMAANPAIVAPGASTLITVTVTPATIPPSTGITVVGDLFNIGGSSTQTFFDNGTNGDVTPGDNIFSFSTLIPLATSGGNKTISGVASDGQGRVAPVQQIINVNAGLPDEDPLTLGNPSNATTNVANENNYLMVKPQYTISYNRSKATANWVAWRLDSSWIGSAPRQDDYRPDPALPAAWYHVTDTDYSGSGYDRGHMCPSGDRTRSIPDNSATFLMTNMVPQLGANNQGPWNDLENYCRTLAQQGNELYIISGGAGNIGTIANGQVVVPAVTWKVVLVLPNGSNDLQRISRATRAFGVIMSNQSISQGAPWRNFRTTVDAVEVLTGFDFFTEIPKNTQELIEKKRDKQ